MHDQVIMSQHHATACTIWLKVTITFAHDWVFDCY
jgi:hypothetical protein